MAAPKGLKLFNDFISATEEKKLLLVFSDLPWQEIRMNGVIAKRKVIHFGMNYEYDRRSVEPTDPIPKYLLTLKKRVANIMKVKPNEIAEVLITHYPPKAGIGWHKDAKIFGDAVAGVSLVSSCNMKFRRKNQNGFEIYKVELLPRSAYVFSGEARYEWQHTISSHKVERYSVTFRTLRPKLD